MPSNFYAVAKTEKAFVIPFAGLKDGKHTFEFDIVDAFFEQVEYSLIEKGNVHVALDFEKKETMMIGIFTIEGKVTASCDLCNEPVDVDIEGEYKLIFKFDNEPSDDESLIVVYPDEFELDLQGNLLELMTVSLPSRNIHPDGECDSEMMDILDEYRINPDDEDFDEDLDDEDFDDEDLDDEDAETKEEDSITIESEDNADEEDLDGDDDYIDPRWAALKGLGTKEEKE